jgi:hypothetical protein
MWALQALKEAKARGESTTLAHLINTYGSKSLLPEPVFPAPADKPAPQGQRNGPKDARSEKQLNKGAP